MLYHNSMVAIGLFYLTIEFEKNNFIKDLEIGIDDHFEINYQHEWYNHQVHFLNLGFIYLYWRGIPILDDKK